MAWSSHHSGQNDSISSIGKSLPFLSLKNQLFPCFEQKNRVFTKLQQSFEFHFLAIMSNFLDKTWFQKCVQPIFFTKLCPKINFSPKFQVRKKLIAAPPMAILGSKKFGLWATQKCLKVSKI